MYRAGGIPRHAACLGMTELLSFSGNCELSVTESASTRETFTGIYSHTSKITFGDSNTGMRLAILDDYQNVALSMADWDGLRPSLQIQIFRDTLNSEDAVAR